MKTLIAALALSFVSASAFAHDRNSDIARVSALANAKVAGADVRKVITTYNNVEGDPCSAEGIGYIVTVSLRKSVMKEMEDGTVGQVREWREFNRYHVSQEELRNGEGLSDSLCQE